MYEMYNCTCMYDWGSPHHQSRIPSYSLKIFSSIVNCLPFFLELPLPCRSVRERPSSEHQSSVFLLRSRSSISFRLPILYTVWNRFALQHLFSFTSLGRSLTSSTASSPGNSLGRSWKKALQRRILLNAYKTTSCGLCLVFRTLIWGSLRELGYERTWRIGLTGLRVGEGESHKQHLIGRRDWQRCDPGTNHQSLP